jgi:hypothetical protein
MRIFIRMLCICWIVMLLLAASVVFWPAVSSPLQDDRQRTFPLHATEVCARQQLEAYRSLGTSGLLRSPSGCPDDAQLMSADNDTATDLAGRSLSSEEAQLVHRAAHTHATAIRNLTDSTIVAFEADSDSPFSPIYLVTFSHDTPQLSHGACQSCSQTRLHLRPPFTASRGIFRSSHYPSESDGSGIRRRRPQGPRKSFTRKTQGRTG